MNERIEQLERQATETVKCGLNGTSTAESFNRKKFAELIVRECVRYFNEDYERNFETLWREDLSKGMKEHFGVEE